jgi:hypothetical protein
MLCSRFNGGNDTSKDWFERVDSTDSDESKQVRKSTDAIGRASQLGPWCLYQRQHQFSINASQSVNQKTKAKD